jgi:hypothetical protein
MPSGWPGPATSASSRYRCGWRTPAPPRTRRSAHLRQDGVPQPAGADGMGGDPRQVLAEAHPQVVVAAAGQPAAVAVAQQRVGAARVVVAALVPVGELVPHQGR